MATELDPVDAFRYPRGPLARRHGPAGYANPRSFRPWLRDEFAFRCVYCLVREQWGRVTGEFDVEHFLPQVCRPERAVAYDNLLYACRPCNLRKRAAVLPDPAQALTAETVRIYPDGTMAGLTANAERIIRVLCLNSLAWTRWRRTWIRIVELAAVHDPELLRELLGYPSDLPNLETCRAPRNTHPEGVQDSFFARRTRGELPETYLN